MTEQRWASADPSWNEYGADEWADAALGAMRLGGVERLYFCSGSELSFFQEGVARARSREWPAPKLVTMVHEGAALNAAIGDAMVTGQPAATAAHVDVGTFNYGAGLHTAWRGAYPVLIMAGTGPRAYPGSMAGARDGGVQWVQEPRDQGEIVRQYMKLDHRMEHQDNPGLMVSRMLQVAMSEPKGPVYLSFPQETARLPMPGVTRYPTRDQLGVARPAWPDPADAKRAAEWLIAAGNPLICLGNSGRNPESVEEIVRLAELLALPVRDTLRVQSINFPTSHPLYGTGPEPKDADALLIFEAQVPFIPPAGAPAPSAKIVWADPDPVQSRYKTMEFRADLWLPTATAGAARAIYEAATGLLSASDRSRIAERRKRLDERKRELAAAEEALALEAGKRTPIHPRWVAYQLGQMLEPEAILLDDALSSSVYVRAHTERTQPGTYFKSGGSAGGWGSGAAFGAKMAKPERDVVLATGDGYFMFGTPLASLWSAAHYGAPFLTVVFVNRSYSTGTIGLKHAFPEGEAVGAGDYEGGLFDPPPNFAKLAEAANGYGEEVTDPAEVGPALRRGLDQVRNGSPALVAVHLPTLVEEMAAG